VQKLLVAGRKEEAAREAFLQKQYSVSLTIAGMCGVEVYRQAVANFAASNLEPGSPLYSVSMMFSQQIKTPPTTFWGNGPETLRTSWKTHLTAIINNRVRGWDNFVLSLGDQLMKIGEVEAAHFCYVYCGCPVAPPARSEVRLTLLGCEVSPVDMTLGTDASIKAFARTEAYEWAKRRGNASALIQCIQPLKLAYAMQLADFGFVESAATYVRCIQSNLGNSVTPPGAKSTEPLWLACITGNACTLDGALSNFQLRLAQEQLDSNRSKSEGWATDKSIAHSPSGHVGEIRNTHNDSRPSDLCGKQGSDTIAATTSFHIHKASLHGLSSIPPTQNGGPPVQNVAPPPLAILTTISNDGKPPLFTPANQMISNRGEATITPQYSNPPQSDDHQVNNMENYAIGDQANGTSHKTAEKPKQQRSAPMSAPANLEQSKSNPTPNSSAKSKLVFAPFLSHLANALVLTFFIKNEASFLLDLKTKLQSILTQMQLKQTLAKACKHTMTISERYGFFQAKIQMKRQLLLDHRRCHRML
jgi:hypothetical protein